MTTRSIVESFDVSKNITFASSVLHIAVMDEFCFQRVKEALIWALS